jgi:hypothetical protein
MLINEIVRILAQVRFQGYPLFLVNEWPFFAGELSLRRLRIAANYFCGIVAWLDSAMFGSLTSPKRQRVNTLRLIHSLALRACILNGFLEHGAVQLAVFGRRAVKSICNSGQRQSAAAARFIFGPFEKEQSVLLGQEMITRNVSEEFLCKAPIPR